MQWFDAGVNLMDPRFNQAQVLRDCASANIIGLCIIASNVDESLRAQQFIKAAKHPIQLYTTAGVHPHNADQVNESDWQKIALLLEDDTCIAVGECGLDFNRNYSAPTAQLQVFERQLEIASQLTKPLYLHQRDAFSEQHALLKRYLRADMNALAHCFTGDQHELNAYLELGCYIGITGWLCDAKRGESLRKAVQDLPLNRLILETDAPYLFPKTVKPRASQNAPKYISHIAQTLAELMQLPVATIAAASLSNAQQLFKLN